MEEESPAESTGEKPEDVKLQEFEEAAQAVGPSNDLDEGDFDSLVKVSAI